LLSFTLDGPRGAKYRQVVRRLAKDGGAFRVVDASDVRLIVGQLRSVSDDWLAAKGTAEKGFSLGFFDEAYVRRFPVGVVEVDGRILAFANIFQGPGGEEVSIDLMRSTMTPPARDGSLDRASDALGPRPHRRLRRHGAALGFEHSATVSLWSRLGLSRARARRTLQAARRGTFADVEPQYWFPGGGRMPRVLADLSALVAGGYWKIFQK
jgi:phosphatidylglycerol lysyltransferase